MNRAIFALPVALALAACAPNSPSPTPRSVCADIAAVKAAPDAAAQLARLDPHSALGSIWAYAQSGCVGPAPTAGVDASWTSQVWGMAKVLIPQVLPQVLPLLIGLL